MHPTLHFTVQCAVKISKIEHLNLLILIYTGIYAYILIIHSTTIKKSAMTLEQETWVINLRWRLPSYCTASQQETWKINTRHMEY